MRSLAPKKLERLGWNGYAVLNDQDALALERKTKDGTTLLSVYNLNFDPMRTINLRVPAKPKRIRLLGQDGQWSEPAWTVCDGGVSISARLICSEVAVFNIEY